MTTLEEQQSMSPPPKKVVQALIPLDGLIKNARWQNPQQTKIKGQLHNDSKSRWDDGSTVVTSKIIKMITFNVALTNNSLYGIEWADEEEIKKDWKHG